MTPAHKAQRVGEERIQPKWRRVCSGRLQIGDDVNWSGGGGETGGSGVGVCDVMRTNKGR
jgi:hypothetical protein